MTDEQNPTPTRLPNWPCRGLTGGGGQLDLLPVVAPERWMDDPDGDGLIFRR